MTRLLGFGLAAVLVTALALAFVVPLQVRSGTLDTTRNQCPSLPRTTKHYHLLGGQLHDYRLVRQHLAAPSSVAPGCGQAARLELYL